MGSRWGGGGLGLFFAIRSPSNFRAAADIDRSARSYRDRANRLVLPSPAPGERRMAIRIGFAF